jgi:hypothetical protein
MLATETGEKLETQTKSPVQKRKRAASVLSEGTDNIKVAKFCLDDEEEKAEYEKILNNSALQIFRDEFIFDKLGKAQVVIWYYS